MEQSMLDAHKMQAQGMKQKEIAQALGVTDRTVRNYLCQNPRKRKKPERKSKLDQFKTFIRILVEENPTRNGELIYDRVRAMGYEGKRTVLKEYITQLRKEIATQAVIRFETEPGYQAQVDWVDFGKQNLRGGVVKLYAFTMVLGYSRYPFVKFTTSMKSDQFLSCHQEAFRFFGGVPKEILYDNMKTAWIYDGEIWKPNKRLSAFSFHYSFNLKRCRVRRPETKGKVERFNQYLSGNFFAGLEINNLDLRELNHSVREWIDKIKDKGISGLSESRLTRFTLEKDHLSLLPKTSFDVRDLVVTAVNRESCVVWKTNYYSVPPQLLGKQVVLRPSVDGHYLDVYYADTCLRSIILVQKGSRLRIIDPTDRKAIQTRWEKDRERLQVLRNPKKRTQRAKEISVSIRHPSVYEVLLTGGIL